MSDAPATSKKSRKEKLTGKQDAFVDQYFLCDFNGTDAAAAAHYKGDRAQLAVIASQNLSNPKIQAAIEARLAERTMSRDEVLIRLADQARSTMDDFITLHTVRSTPTVPTPIADVIDSLTAQIAFEEAYAERAELSGKELETHKGQIATIKRRILRLTMRLERDPAATEDMPGPPVTQEIADIDLGKAAARGKLHLVKSFNAKDGKVELYDKHAALVDIGKTHGLFKDVVELQIPWDDLTPEQLRRIRDGEDPKKVLRER